MSEKTGKKSIFGRWWFWVLAVLLIIIIGNSLNKDETPTPGADNRTTGEDTAGELTSEQTTDQAATQDTAQATTQTTTQGTVPEQTTTEAAAFNAGMYKIGTDLPAGEYILITNSILPAYLQVSSDSTGSLESIISNDNFSGNRYVTVTDGQYLEFTGSKGYPQDKAPSLVPADKTYSEGMYKVGKDIDAGEYKVIPDEAAIPAYVEVSKDSSGILGSIVSNDNFQAEKYVTIAQGQYIKLVGCHINAK